MSIRDAANRTGNAVTRLDESTPVTTKLSGLIAIALAAYAIGGWVRAVNTDGETISATGAKVDAMASKMETMTGALNELSSSVRILTLRQRYDGVASVPESTARPIPHQP